MVELANTSGLEEPGGKITERRFLVVRARDNGERLTRKWELG